MYIRPVAESLCVRLTQLLQPSFSATPSGNFTGIHHNIMINLPALIGSAVRVAGCMAEMEKSISRCSLSVSAKLAVFVWQPPCRKRSVMP
eukprot:5398270-Amphidinium_carterae.1